MHAAAVKKMADRRGAFYLQTSPCNRPSDSHQSREHRSSYDESDLGTHKFNYGEINHPRPPEQRSSTASLADQPALGTADSLTLFIRGI